MGPSSSHRGSLGGALACLAAAVLLGLAGSGHAFELRELVTPGGLRVWLLPQAGVATVALVVHVPVGSSADPAGKEGLAHYVEHMLFTDNHGRDELDFFKELTSHGGHADARTTRGNTFFRIEAPAEHTMLTLDWTRRLLLDHAFDAEVARKERDILLLESNLTPAEPLDHLRRVFERIDVFPEPSLWEREFGLVEDERAVGGTYESVQRVTLSDLQAFYDHHYRLEDMTLFLVGGFDASVVQQQIIDTFSPSLPPVPAARRAPPAPPTLVNPRRYRQEVHFSHAGIRTYAQVFKVYGAGQQDVVTLLFLRDFLREYLNDELRFKERSTYGVRTDVRVFKTAAYLEITGEFADDRWNEARLTINRLLDDVRLERLDGQRFAEYRERARVDHALTAKTPEMLARNFTSHYYDRDVFATFPDVEAAYRELTAAEVGAFARRWMVPENQIRRFTLPAPLSRSVEAGLTALVAVIIWLGLRRRWLRPVDLRKLRYLRKLHHALPQRLVFAAVAVVAYVLYQQTLIHTGERIERLFQGVESYWLRLLIKNLLRAAWIYLSAVPFTLYPRRILVLSDGLLIKFWVFRSWWIPFSSVEDVETCRGLRLVNLRRYGLTCPLTLGVLAPGIHIRRTGRPSLFLQTRNVRELAETVRNLRAAHATALLAPAS